MVGLMEAVKTKKTLQELALKVNHIRMNLKDLKTMLKPIRSFHRLSDLKLDV